jgi:trimeric autotransporter adhesin
MVLQTPLILISGVTSQLPPGDLVPAQDTTAQASGNAALALGTTALASGNAALIVGGDALASGNAALIVGGNALASGNAALTSAATALASGNAALIVGGDALASGNAALTGLSSKVSKGGDVISGTLVVDSQSYGVVSSTVSSGVILIDFSANNNFDVTLEGNSTLAPSVAPSGGQSGAIFIRQDSVGSRTLAYSGGWSFANGSAPTLTTTASGTDLLAYYAAAPTAIVGNLIAAVSGV